MDNKYGRIFTEEDVKKILDLAGTVEWHRVSLDWIVDDLDKENELKFPKDEPVFVLRGQDKRAIGALRYYRDHQNPRANGKHLDSIDKAYDAFADFRVHRETKEPD